jgi:hypothetical protein
MSDGIAEYTRKVINRSGYVLMFPNVEAVSELLSTPVVNPYAESSTQQFPLGTRAIQGEREFVYCLNGASALSTLGTPIQSAARIHAEMDDDIVVGAAAAIGDYSVELTSTANLAAAPLSTANGIAEGYLIVNDAAGEGQMYKIKSHDAFSGTSDATITLYDPLTVALTTSSQCGLIQNPFSKVIATTAPLTGTFVGVNLIAVTASYYFWAQYRGPAPVNAHEAISVGQPATVGLTAAKVDAYDVTSTILYVIGVCQTPGVADTEKCIVFLRG